MSTFQNEKPKDTPVTQVPMGVAKEELIENLFYRLAGSRPDLEERLQAAFKKKYGVPMMKLVDGDVVRAMYLEGPSGHGKTETHRAAAREFAELLGMRFLDNPGLNMVKSGLITRNDFVFNIIDLGGETSNKEIGGLMAKIKVDTPDGKSMEFMGHLPDWRLAATAMGGFGYVLFDDFPASTYQVQNSALGMLLNGSIAGSDITLQDLAAAKKGAISASGEVVFETTQDTMVKTRPNASPVHVGLAGNRGTADLNKVFPITVATSTRVQRYDVFDPPKAWAERALTRFNDEYGDAGVVSFILANTSKQASDIHRARAQEVDPRTNKAPLPPEEVFYKLPKPENGMMSQSPVSRSWDAFVSKARFIFHRHGGLSGISSMTPEQQKSVVDRLTHTAGSFVGDDVAMKLALHYTSLFEGVAPIVDKIIKHGEIESQLPLITKKYENGHSMDGLNFGYSFAGAMGTAAAAQISDVMNEFGSVKTGSLEKTLEMLADASSEPAKRIRETCRHFAAGLYPITQQSLVSYAFDQFLKRSLTLAPDLFSSFDKEEKVQLFKVPNQEFLFLAATGMILQNEKYLSDPLHKTIGDQLSRMGGSPGSQQFDDDR